MPVDTTQLSPAKRALLAKRLRGDRKPQTTIPQRPSKTSAPLSFSQQRLWFLTQLEPDHPFYNIPTALRLEGDLDIEAFQQALNHMVDRHEILRTTFATVDDQPQQVIHPQQSIPITKLNLAVLSPADQEQEVQRLAVADSAKAFDLHQGPLLRVTLIQRSTTESVLLFTLHHIISDAWSTGIFVRELVTLYTAARQSKALTLSKLPIQYGDFAHWQRHQTDRLAQQLNYWQQQFSSLPPVLALPTDRPRPTQQSYQGDRCTIELSERLTMALKQLAQENNCTLFMVLLASFQTLLHRYAHQSDVTVGTPIANRNQTEIEGVIGFFLNTLALRADLSGNPTFRQLLEQVREQTLGAYSHQDLPFEKLIDELDVPRNLSHSPLFQVMLILQNAPTASLNVPGLTLTPLRYDTHTTKFDLTLICTEQNKGLTALMEFSTDLYNLSTIERMLAHWQTLLEGIVEQPETVLSDLPLLTPCDRKQRLDWNNTQAEYPLNQPLHVWIEQQVDRTPDAIATCFASPSDQNGPDAPTSLTYQELDHRANKLAHTLNQLGVGPDTLVGVCLERSLDLVISLLSILKTGGAYVPLDPDYPAERIADMVADAQPAIILTQAALRSQLANHPCLILDQDWEQIVKQPHTRPHTFIHPENLAYVIYTSGSTGKPKGVMNTHAAICNRLLWMQETFGLTSTDRVLQKTPFSFDVSVWEFFWPLMTGAKLVVAKPGGHRDSSYLLDCIQTEKITTIHFVPAMLSAFLETPGVERATTSLKSVIASGEALPVTLQDKFHQRLKAQLHNLYGPTEAAIDVSHWHCKNVEQQLSVPLGYPIANIQLHVLDQHLQPVPVGVSGELHIGGIGLARGYLNRPGLTAEKFIPDPFRQQPGARLYKTGDLVRYLPTGALDFLGRIDHQVKIRGLRIELGEIEATLQQHPQIKEVAVKVHTAPSGAKQLVAYGVTEGELTRADIQKWLGQKLPDYMVPGQFVYLPQLPLSPNGKVDRRALGPPDFEPVQSGQHSPETPAEMLLADIWSQLLNLSAVGIDDNFFELGGDSILSLQVVSRATQAGLRLTPKQLFQHQTIRALAQVADTVSIIQAEQAVAGERPLLPIQHWFFEQALPNPDHWNQSVLLQVPSSLTFSEVQHCVAQLLQHHDELRSQFSPSQSIWTQTLAETLDKTPFHEIDLKTLSPKQQTLTLSETVAHLQSSLNLTTGPILKIVLFRTAPQETDRLAIILHHLVVDGISWRILLDDFQTLLKQQPLPAKTCSVRQWSQQLKGYDALSQKGFWVQQGTETPPLPMDFPDGENTHATRTSCDIQFSIAETSALVHKIPKAYSATVIDLVVAALVRSMTQWSEQTCLRIDFEGHGRADLGLDISRTVGWFTTLYPVRFDLSDTLEMGTALKTIKEQLRQIPDQGLGYGILRYLTEDIELQAQAPAPIRFNYLGQFELGTDAPFSIAPESMGALKGLDNPCTHALTVDAEITEGQLAIHFGYSQAQYQTSTIETIAEQFCGELRSLISHCLDPQNHGYTPSDFPLAQVNQSHLDSLVAKQGRFLDLYPLSPAQQGILFHTLFAPNTGLYVTQFSYRLQGSLNIEALQQAWQTVIVQNPVLRTAFAWEGLDQSLQYVASHAPLPWDTVDLSQETPQSWQKALDTILYDDRVKGFDLDQAPLMRLQLIRLSEDTHELIWSFHHLILDGWSLPLVLHTVFQHYAALEQKHPFAAPTPRPYRDYICWLSSQDQTQANNYWRQYLQGFAAPTPLGGQTDAPLGSRADRKQGYICLEYFFDEQISTALQYFSQQHHLTTNTLAQGAWAILLSHISTHPDVVFGATTSGRPPELLDSEKMVGVFINTLPVRVQVAPEMEILPWLMEIQKQQTEARQYEYCSLNQVQQLTAVPKGTSLFESLLVFENYPVDATAFQNMPTSIKLQDFHSTSNNSYPLTVRVLPGAALKLEMMVDLTRFPASQIERWLQEFAAILRQISDDTQSTVGDVLKHLQTERQQEEEQKVQTLETTSIGKLKRIRRKAVAPSNQEVSS